YIFTNMSFDSHFVYIIHPYAMSFRGFVHNEFTFICERAMDILAEKLAMDPLELRLINAIKPGDTTPTQTHLNASNIGDVTACLNKLKTAIKWDGGKKTLTPEGNIRSKGISCFWKTSSTPSNATAGAIIKFNKDRTVNLNCA